MRFTGKKMRSRVFSLPTTCRKNKSRPDLRELAAVADDNVGAGLSASRAISLNRLDDIHALGHVSELWERKVCVSVYITWRGATTDSSPHLHLLTSDERTYDDVLAIKPVSLDGAEEELRAVGVRSSVGHGENTFAR